MKKCKGTHKDTYGLGCGKINKYRKLGLGYSDCKCYSDFLLNTEAGISRLKKATLKVQKPRLELEKAELEHKTNKRLSYLLTNVKNACHNFIKKRDKGKPCISCGEPWHSDFQAGHFYKAELYSTLKFDETNIHGQCQGCNLFNDGNESGYRVGLIERYGKEYVDELDKKALLEKSSQHKWDRFNLNKVRDYFKEKLKEYG